MLVGLTAVARREAAEEDGTGAAGEYVTAGAEVGRATVGDLRVSLQPIFKETRKVAARWL